MVAWFQVEHHIINQIWYATKFIRKKINEQDVTAPQLCLPNHTGVLVFD